MLDLSLMQALRLVRIYLNPYQARHRPTFHPLARAAPYMYRDRERFGGREEPSDRSGKITAKALRIETVPISDESATRNLSAK